MEFKKEDIVISKRSGIIYMVIGSYLKKTNRSPVWFREKWIIVEKINYTRFRKKLCIVESALRFPTKEELAKYVLENLIGE